MTKPGLSAERHAEIGRRLYQLREEVFRLAVEVEEAYPRSAKYPRALNRTLQLLDRSRTEGDAQLAFDHPEEAGPDAYYPAPSRRP